MKQRTIIFSLLLSLISLDSFAQNDNIITEMNGLMIDETITKIGHDYYDLIYRDWEMPDSEASFTIYVRERPQPGFGSRVSVVVNETTIVERFLSPRYDVMEAEAQYAVQQLKQYVENYNQLINSLIEEDKQGTGIY